MEFALSAPVVFAEADDSWKPGGSRSFLFSEPRAITAAPLRATDWSDIATCTDRDLWRCWDPGTIRPPGRGANPPGEHLPLRYLARQFVRLLRPRVDRPIHAQSHGDFPGLACRHRRRLLRRVHDVLQFRLGNGENAGSRRVVVGHGLCGSKRGRRTALERRRNSPFEQVLRT